MPNLFRLLNLLRTALATLGGSATASNKRDEKITQFTCENRNKIVTLHPWNK